MRPFFPYGYAPRSSYGARPSLEDLLDPYAEPEYPEEPARITRGQDLSKQDRRGLTMEMLANIASSISGPQGYLGSRLAQSAQANLGAEQGAIGRANEAAQQDYRRRYQKAQQASSEAEQRAGREQKRVSIESMLTLGDQAIEAAGGPEADPAFASRVYGFMRERNASALQGAVKEGSERRTMREKYKVDPDDSAAMESFKSKRELDAKMAEETAIGGIRQERAVSTHKQERDYDLAHPLPREPREPQRDRVWFDPTSGQIINLDTGQAGPPLGGYTPRPRSGGIMDEVEQEAWDAAQRERGQFENSPRRPIYQNRNPRMPGFTPDAGLIGKPVPFDVESAYRANERTMRKLLHEKEAAADPSTGVRGPAPSGGKGIQAPKGAPVGVGGLPTLKPAPKPEIERKVAAVAAQIGGMTEQQKKLVRQKLAGGMTPDQVVAEIKRRRGGG